MEKEERQEQERRREEEEQGQGGHKKEEEEDEKEEARKQREMEEHEERRQEQGVGKEGQEEGIKVVEVETDWVMVRRRRMQRRQQESDERSEKSDGRQFKGGQIVVKVDESKTCIRDAALHDKVNDILREIPNGACHDKRDVCV